MRLFFLIPLLWCCETLVGQSVTDSLLNKLLEANPNPVFQQVIRSAGLSPADHIYPDQPGCE